VKASTTTLTSTLNKTENRIIQNSMKKRENGTKVPDHKKHGN
jgi:hypothetical protein